eukprot:6424382-Karenia_brevis.AAC.1
MVAPASDSGAAQLVCGSNKAHAILEPCVQEGPEGPPVVLWKLCNQGLLLDTKEIDGKSH